MLKRKHSGFSLLELVTVLIIIGVIVSFSTPLMLTIYKKNQIDVLKNELITVVKFARTMAILQDRALVLTPLKGRGDWSRGAMLLVDTKKHNVIEGATILHQWQWKNQGLSVAWEGLHSKNYLLFAADPAHAASSGHFIMKDSDGHSLRLTVNRLGRIREELSNNK